MMSEFQKFLKERKPKEHTLRSVKAKIRAEIAAWKWKLRQPDISTIDYAMYDYAVKFAEEILEELERVRE